jgi:hypothetical protein
MLQRFMARPGRIDMEDERTRLYLPAVPDTAHVFAQLNDYQATKTFTQSAPFSARLQATVSAAGVLGSFGFGLWNEAVTDKGEAQPASDGFVFLYSRSSNADQPLWQAVAWQATGDIQQTDLSDIAIAKPHRYTLDWQAEAIRFEVDGVERLRINQPVNSPLGFVMWMSNRTMQFGPGGKLATELCAIPEAQWLEVKALKLK